MNLSDLKQSKFLKKEDVGVGVLVTISGLSQENVAKEGAEPDMKTVLHLNELDKPMVLNSTNGQLIASITGISDDIDTGWIGHQIVLYSDPSISFNGKLVGGIRVRAVRKAAIQRPPVRQLVQQPALPQAPVSEDDCPF